MVVINELWYVYKIKVEVINELYYVHNIKGVVINEVCSVLHITMRCSMSYVICIT